MGHILSPCMLTRQKPPLLSPAAPATVLPLRSQSRPLPASVAVHSLPGGDGVLIKVTPPTAPEPVPASVPAADSAAAGTATATTTATTTPLKHVPCDIVIVIDESGSMESPAPAPGETVEEDNGLTILDLCKHAYRTILQTLDEDDRLGLVTFSGSATVLQPLTSMTPANKLAADEKIDAMHPRNSTNLWAGMCEGIRLFDGKADSGRMPAIMILTDGQPNFMSPEQGFVPMMRKMPEFRPAGAVPIHTFGFGYDLRAGLLKSISEHTNGNYSFIPDAGMIATVANMQATFASHAVLRLRYPAWLHPELASGTVVTEPVQKPTRDTNGNGNSVLELAIPLGSIQYGQSRDVYLQYTVDAHGNNATVLKAIVEYRHMTPQVHQVDAQCDLDGRSTNTLSPAEVAFHRSRAMLCKFIASINPLDEVLEHRPLPYSESLGTSLQELIRTLPAAAAPDVAQDAACAALVADITRQAQMALSNNIYYNRWGIYYLPSLQGAHAVQQCNSFKDAGPLLYGANSPLFTACRDALDTAFYKIPPPKPSGFGFQGHWGQGLSAASSTVIDMHAYNNSMGPCFASFCRVTLANGQHVRVNRLRRGMCVSTPRGSRAVAAVLKTPVRSTPMVAIGRLLITAWHPVSHNGSKWVFPCRDPTARTSAPVRYTGAIYSILLQRDRDPDAHAVSIEGIWVVTLGHGLTPRRQPAGLDDEEDVEDEEEDENKEVVTAAAAAAGAAVAKVADVRTHSFFGDYDAVCRSMAAMDVRKDGIVVNGGSVRSNFRRWHAKK